MCLLLAELEVTEVHFEILAAGVRDAEFGSLHAAQFIAGVDNRVGVFVMQQADGFPSTVDKEFELKVLGHVVHAEVEVHTGKSDFAVAFDGHAAILLPLDYFVRGGYADFIATCGDGQQGQLLDVGLQLERIEFSHVAEFRSVLRVVSIDYLGKQGIERGQQHLTGQLDAGLECVAHIGISSSYICC